MCLILCAWQAHPDYALIVAANRDEYFHRPAAPAQFWSAQPEILGGRDLEQGGTWLGLRTDGRFAAVTNFRRPGELIAGAPSRGALTSAFLQSQHDGGAFLHALAPAAQHYNGFNLLVTDRHTLWHYSNRGGQPRQVPPGIHGLSNHLLNTAWPKVVAGKARLQHLLAGAFSAADLLALLDNTEIPADEALPDTGVGLERERRLGAVRIVSAGYGTRCSTAVLIGHDGSAEFCERSFAEDGSVLDTVGFRFALNGAAASGAL